MQYTNKKLTQHRNFAERIKAISPPYTTLKLSSLTKKKSLKGFGMKNQNKIRFIRAKLGSYGLSFVLSSLRTRFELLGLFFFYRDNVTLLKLGASSISAVSLLTFEGNRQHFFVGKEFANFPGRCKVPRRARTARARARG